MAEPQTAPALSGKVRALLIGSLALNLLLLGLFVGIIATDRLPGGPPRGFDLTLGPLTEALAPEDRRAIGEALRDRVPGDRRAGRAEAYRALTAALSQEPFDREGVERLLEEQAARATDLRRLAQQVFLDRIAGMSPEDRAEFLDRISRHGGDRH